MAGFDPITSAQLKTLYGGGNYGFMSNFGVGGASSAAPALDVESLKGMTKDQAAEWVDSLKQNKGSVSTLKKDTARFLDKYTLSMKTLDQSASKLTNGGIGKMLYGFDGESSDKEVSNVVGAVEDMVKNYNDSVKLLNDNYDRGDGVGAQLSRMVEDPAPERSMAMVGMSVNDDGTLALDKEKLTAALTNEDANLRDMYTNILGGFGGIAENIQSDVNYGMNMPANRLVNNDLSDIKSQQEDNPFTEMYNSFKGSAFGMSNQAATGMLMNLLV